MATNYIHYPVQGSGGGGGGGTVTSVGLALPVSVFTVSGSPVTTTGTLTGTFTTQAANTVFAGPTSGGAATPTFRALVAGDIPSLGSLYLRLDGTNSPTATIDWGGQSLIDVNHMAALQVFAGTSTLQGPGTLPAGFSQFGNDNSTIVAIGSSNAFTGASVTFQHDNTFQNLVDLAVADGDPDALYLSQVVSGVGNLMMSWGASASNVVAVGANMAFTAGNIGTTPAVNQVVITPQAAITQTYSVPNDNNFYFGTHFVTLPTGNTNTGISGLDIDVDVFNASVYTGTSATSCINTNNFCSSTSADLTNPGNVGIIGDAVPSSGSGLAIGLIGGGISIGSFTGVLVGVLGQPLNFGGTPTATYGVVGDAAQAVNGTNCFVAGMFFADATNLTSIPMPPSLVNASVAVVAHMSSNVNGDLFRGYHDDTLVAAIDFAGDCYFNGSLSIGYQAVATSTTLTGSNAIVGVTNTSSAWTITLPTGVKPGFLLVVKDQSGGAATHNITIAGAGGETIDGAATVAITQNFGVIRLYNDGSNWFSM